jgi:hypothetical protein
MNPGLEKLVTIVEKLGADFCSLDERSLNQPWQWGDYDEGVRFAFFRVYESLRQKTAVLTAERKIKSAPITAAQHILLQYNLAYRDLQAVLLGVGDALADQRPSEQEWSVRMAVAHMVGAEVSFHFINSTALRAFRSGNPNPPPLQEQDWQTLEESHPFYKIAEQGPLSALMDYYQNLHRQVLADFAFVTDDELELRVWFWESQALPLRFRLHRFDSHLRQHTIQVEKTLPSIGHSPIESRLLLRRIYQALAELEGVCIGADQLPAETFEALENDLQGYAAEIAKALGKMNHDV